MEQRPKFEIKRSGQLATGLAMTSRVGEFIARNPRLEMWRIKELSYVVGNQSGWVGKPAKLLSIHLIYPLDPKT